ncbi:MAG: OmpH family outer membrane protein [Paludibacteraceae bacterium]|nr:OmpH family outer membrane protein [Paludibacteraceae bacterium]
MFKKLLVALFVAAPFVGSVAQNTQVKLGHLDAQSLFLSLPEAKQIDSTMKKLTAQHENEIKRMEEEYNRKLAEYKQGESQFDETIKRSRTEELQTLQMKMQNYYQQAQSLLQQRQNELLAPVQDKVKRTIEEVGAENGFLYIFDSSVILFKSEQSIDVAPLVKKKMGVK